jgi:hypothetical protein
MLFKNKYLISLYCTIIVFALNFFIPSYTNGFPKKVNLSFYQLWDNPNATEVYNTRMNESEFRRRPVVLQAQRFMHEKFHLPFQFSFNFINYSFLFGLFIFLPILSQKINSEKIEILFITVFTLFSFPIVFAFFGSISSHDDFVQYVLITLALINIIDKKQLYAMIFFTSSCITRETSLIFFPFLLIYDYFINKNNIIRIMYWIFPIVIYGLFLLWFLDETTITTSKNFMATKRFYAWQSNFKNFNTFRETTTITSVMTLIPISLLVMKLQNEDSRLIRFLTANIFGLIVLNTVLVLTTGLAREARLFFPPLLIAIPVIYREIKVSYIILKNSIVEQNLISKQTLFIVISSFIIGFIWYTPMTVGTGIIFKFYVFIYFCVFFTLLNNNFEAFKLVLKNIVQLNNGNSK